ncbi:MAG: hypothetical protein ACXWC8_03915 [Limisphaerales bacterium]
MSKAKRAVAEFFGHLRRSPTDPTTITADQMKKSWAEMVQAGVNPAKPFLSTMVALVLSDETFRSLINNKEYEQLCSIAANAVEEYNRLINPEHQIGRQIADVIKEAQEEEE